MRVDRRKVLTRNGVGRHSASCIELFSRERGRKEGTMKLAGVQMTVGGDLERKEEKVRHPFCWAQMRVLLELE